MEMDNGEFQLYLSCISKIRSTEMLEEMSIVDYPNMKSNARSDRVSQLENEAKLKEEKKVLSMDELADQLSRM